VGVPVKRYRLETSIPVLVILLLSFFFFATSAVYAQEKAAGTTIKLPAPKLDGTVSVEKALAERRSVRAYRAEALSMAEVSQILWAAQGITEPGKGLRTAASARGMFLLEVYLVAGTVTGLPAGLYRYQPKGHELLKLAEGDKKAELAKAGQAAINSAPVALVITGASDRAASNPPWMYMEAGHAAQNVYLQSVSLGLGTVSMAGFKPEEVKSCLNLPEKEQPLYIMPVGRK
jgi:SagB-type dehydrogenase family enzyme